MSTFVSRVLPVTLCLLVIMASALAVVIPRPPSTLHAYQPSPLRRPYYIATSSELPKQIPAPSQPPHHSSTPQYVDEEEQIPGTAQLRLVWVTQEMGTSAPAQTPKLSHKSYDQRTDLMPNMI